MSEIVITPNGRDALQLGTLIDDDGERFVVLTFSDPDVRPLIVTMTDALFLQYADHVGKLADAIRDGSAWTD